MEDAALHCGVNEKAAALGGARLALAAAPFM
jgi:hypothetical protein